MFCWLRCWAFMVFCAIVALPAFAGVTGAISGRVVDPSGAVVPNVAVELTSTEIAALLLFWWPQTPPSGRRLI